jgi:Ion channel
LNKKLHQNIGVYLYQELLNNSRQQSQPDFAQDALFQFRRWLRFEQIYKLRQNDVARISRFELSRLIVQSWLAEKLLGFGVHLKNYCFTAVSTAYILALINYHFCSSFGLKIGTFIDALYFTTITLTTIGYGDITPTTTCGRLVIAGEGVAGFVLFAILASMVYRKILP